MDDLISRKWLMECVDEGWIKFDTEKDTNTYIHLVRDIAPSTQPERLTDDDFETIRIHLNAYKEKLCNERRWEEADEYQRIIDRFMAFASAQQDCTECKEYDHETHSCPHYCEVIRKTLEEAKQERTGRWIKGKYKDTCDSCRCTYPKNIGFKNYCPNCGARMEENNETD